MKMDRQSDKAKLSVTSSTSKKQTAPESPVSRVMSPTHHTRSNFFKMRGSCLFAKRCFSLTDSNWFTQTEGKTCLDLHKLKHLETPPLRSLVRISSRPFNELNLDISELHAPPSSLLRAYESLR